MMGNYHVRFGKGSFDLSTWYSVMVRLPTSLIITAHAFIMSAPSHPIEDCGRTPQVVHFCVVGKSDELLHITSLSDRIEPNKTI